MMDATGDADPRRLRLLQRQVLRLIESADEAVDILVFKLSKARWKNFWYLFLEPQWVYNVRMLLQKVRGTCHYTSDYPPSVTPLSNSEESTQLG